MAGEPGASRSTRPLRVLEHDVTRPLEVEGPLDGVLHLASPASPKDYLAHPIETLDVGSQGTQNMLELARSEDARFLLTSTSECYGDPLEHPQVETYWGNVNSVGPRSCYDEANGTRRRSRWLITASIAFERTSPESSTPMARA